MPFAGPACYFIGVMSSTYLVGVCWLVHAICGHAETFAVLSPCSLNLRR
jgi:hypothetical protein